MSHHPSLTHINHVSDLSEKEKDHLLELIVDRLGCDLFSYKFDGESERIVQLVKRDKRS